MNHVYGIKATKRKVKDAIYAARKVYSGLPETTCDHRTCCCRAGCPNMYYAEFLSIYRGAVEKMSRAQRLELTLGCVQRYLAKQQVDQPKPCPLLSGSDCSAYEFRPLKCRLYGLIPAKLYEWVTESVAKEMNVSKEQVPLCVQCDRVKIAPKFSKKFPDGTVPEDDIRKKEFLLRENDLDFGMPVKIQNQGYGYLTYHDWHLMFELGEQWLEKLSKVRLTATEDEKEGFMKVLRDAMVKRDAEEMNS